MNAGFMQCVFLLNFCYFPLMYYAIKIQFSNVKQADELAACGLLAAHDRFSSLELTAFIPEASLERAEAE